ncbi:MAG: hypothetical protein KDB49_04245 [Mycobacterium sp.]|nr:hypothetical protein [Mycobacterium sp.]
MSGLHHEDIPADPQTIIVVPRGIKYIYERDQGDDIIGLLIDDPRLGPILVALSPTASAHVSLTLAQMVGSLDKLRADWHMDNPEDEA